MRVILVALLFIPAALAGSAPELMFFLPGASPLADGEMSSEQPDKLESSSSFILPGTADLPSLSFVSSGDHAERIYGPLLLGLWTGPSPVLSGNLTAILSDGESILGSGTVDMTLDPEALPDPASLVPPDPTDPEQAAAYIAAQVLLATMNPPVLLDLGFVDANVSADAPITVSFFLEGEPIAIGSASLQYDGALTPSFVYVPFYEPDPEPAPVSSGSGQSGSSSQSGAPSGSSGESSETPSLGIGNEDPQSSESKDSPGFGLIAMLGGLLLVGVVRRYKS